MDESRPQIGTVFPRFLCAEEDREAHNNIIDFITDVVAIRVGVQNSSATTIIRIGFGSGHVNSRS